MCEREGGGGPGVRACVRARVCRGGVLRKGVAR